MKETKSKVAVEVHAEGVRQEVRKGYAQIAQKGGSCCSSKPDCRSATPTASEDFARHIGYSAEELAALPDGANMGLSCGNPNALAALQPGEVVLDLGSGGGFDVFIAGRKVGATGRVIGVDMTAEMVAKARSNATVYHEQTGLENVEFRLGEIEHLPRHAWGPCGAHRGCSRPARRGERGTRPGHRPSSGRTRTTGGAHWSPR